MCTLPSLWATIYAGVTQWTDNPTKSPAIPLPSNTPPFVCEAFKNQSKVGWDERPCRHSFSCSLPGCLCLQGRKDDTKRQPCRPKGLLSSWLTFGHSLKHCGPIGIKSYMDKKTWLVENSANCRTKHWITTRLMIKIPTASQAQEHTYLTTPWRPP